MQGEGDGEMERRVPSEADTIRAALKKYDGVHGWRNGRGGCPHLPQGASTSSKPTVPGGSGKLSQPLTGDLSR